MMFSLFISCPKGLEYLLEEEMKELGLRVHQVSPQGVYGDATLSILYQICLWTRIANRVQLILFSGHVEIEGMLYRLCSEFPWQTVLTPDKTFVVEFHGTSNTIRNTMYGAQVVKDAIVDHFRKLHGERPTVDKENANLRIHAYLKHDTLTVSLDLTGYSLHQRGYRKKAGLAPLKENLAAALLIRAHWPKLAKEGYTLLDPFCGAGTLVIEAAMMAAQIAPGLLRQDQSVQHWVGHQPTLWEKCRTIALSQVKPIHIRLAGSDEDPQMIALAKENAEKAGVASLITFETRSLKECQASENKGLLIANPPYGERLGASTTLIPLYQQLGATLHTHFQGWEAAILTSDALLAKAIGLRSHKQYTLYNGALECKLYCITLSSDNRLKGDTPKSLSQGAQMFVNRVKKNHQHLSKWAKRQEIDCYRLYDADLPEYACAVDVYKDHAVLSEYAPPASIDAHKAEIRRLEMIQALPLALNIPKENILIKQRQKQKGSNQYQKIDAKEQSLIVQEGPAKLSVNLSDYLDTGLFLDHRPLRLSFGKLPKNTRFLNCFCYTASASVHAALQGAHTTNIDLSNTYLAWAQKNFTLNHLNLNQHQFIQSDCLTWLKKSRDYFDVIFLDPPSFSNSKRMTDTLDVQRDHVLLIDAAMRLLNPGGTLYFSTNLRQFKLDASLLEKYTVKNITAETIDIDFKRNPRIHQCYTICKTLA